MTIERSQLPIHGLVEPLLETMREPNAASPPVRSIEPTTSQEVRTEEPATPQFGGVGDFTVPFRGVILYEY